MPIETDDCLNRSSVEPKIEGEGELLRRWLSSTLADTLTAGETFHRNPKVKKFSTSGFPGISSGASWVKNPAARRT
jgi:hypothetical protein